MFRHHEEPLCFAMQFDLVREFRAMSGEPPETLRRTLLDKERQCPGFTPWQPGFAPKEHREMLDRNWMREQEERQAEANRAWLKQGREDDRKWQSRQLRVAIAGIIMTLLAAFAGAWASARFGPRPIVQSVTVASPQPNIAPSPAATPASPSSTGSNDPSPSADAGR